MGTVVLSSVSKISAKFPYLGSDLLLHFHAPYRKIEKLNVFSVNQLIRIKSDVLTVTQMEMQFQQHSEKVIIFNLISGFRDRVNDFPKIRELEKKSKFKINYNFI